jgi:hypothetical protein
MVFAADYPLLTIFWSKILFFTWVVGIWMMVAILSDVFRTALQLVTAVLIFNKSCLGARLGILIAGFTRSRSSWPSAPIRSGRSSCS